MKKTINLFLVVSLLFFGTPVYFSNPVLAQVEEVNVCYEIREVEAGDQYASNVVDSYQGLRYNDGPVSGARSIPEQGLKFEAGKNESNFFSLGFGGWIIVEFDFPIFNGTGTDLKITEDTWGGGYPLEKAEVWVSRYNDGDWVSLGIADNTNLNIIHTTTEFDLPVFWEWAKYVKIVDVSVKSDFSGLTASVRDAADGYDLNAVEALYSGAPCPVALEISKTATASFDRDWTWTIDKSETNNVTSLELAIGEEYDLNYEVVLDATSTDSNWWVEGVITIHNPNIIDAEVTSVSDIFGDVVCPMDFTGTLEPGETIECTYEGELQSGVDTVNEVTVVTSGEVPGGIATTSVEFGDPANETDECVDVTDSLEDILGTVCVGDPDMKFSYSYTVGPYTDFGIDQIVNIASFVTNDNEDESSDSWTVDVDVPFHGCTLTQGYWKTHSSNGPAPYDSTWGLIGEDKEFFLSDKSYYQVLWTAPKGGNVYYILAHQYIAAELNRLNEASAEQEVLDALNAATVLFDSYGPNDSILKDKVERKTWNNLAGILADYNEGILGPGHCDEQDYEML